MSRQSQPVNVPQSPKPVEPLKKPAFEPGEFDFVAMKNLGGERGRTVLAGKIVDGQLVDVQVVDRDVSLPVAWEQVRIQTVKRLRK